MGEVYRATDSNLKRQVAIKVLPASVAGDADRLARFQREAEVLAALNHPNIAQIFGLEKTPDFTALVMELVEGEDLSQRIARGATSTDERPLEWLTRDGKTTPLRATKADWANPRFSPNGQKLALDIFDGKQREIWVYEWARDTLTQLTFDPGEDRIPVWTPDGRRIVFSSDRAKTGVPNLYWVNADGTGEVTRLTDSSESHTPGSWHPSGKFFAFHAVRGGTANDLMILPMEGDATRGWTPGTPTVFLSTPASEYSAMFSPDGRWIAYSSNETGISDVYVRPFPGPGGKWRVSTARGNYARWSATTSELLFRLPQAAGPLITAPYTVVGESFRADTPRVWSPAILVGTIASNAGYDLHPDGKRVVAAVGQGREDAAQDTVVFVFNFADYMRTIAPGTQ